MRATAPPAVVRREIDIEGSPDEVWDALRDPSWLGDDGDAADGMRAGSEFTVEEDGVPRRGRVLVSDAPRDDRPGRMTWWWWREGEEATHVDVLVVAAPEVTRVVVTEVGGLPGAWGAGASPIAAAAGRRRWGARLRALVAAPAVLRR
jgi:hypothetical protein